MTAEQAITEALFLSSYAHAPSITAMKSEIRHAREPDACFSATSKNKYPI
jgi:hypothetical protein